MPVVQRTRLILLPLFYNDILIERPELITSIKEDLGADLSVADAGTEETLRFVIEGNPPIRNLYIHLQPSEGRVGKYSIINWIFVT